MGGPAAQIGWVDPQSKLGGWVQGWWGNDGLHNGVLCLVGVMGYVRGLCDDGENRITKRGNYVSM